MKNPRRLRRRGLVESGTYWLTNPGRRGVYDTYDYYYDGDYSYDDPYGLRMNGSNGLGRQRPGRGGDGGNQGKHGGGV